MTLSALTSALGAPPQHVATGWPSIDSSLAPTGLVRGGVHEWYGVSDQLDSDQGDSHQGDSNPRSTPHSTPRSTPRRGNGRGRNPGSDLSWSPPLFLLTHLAAQAVLDADERGAPAHVVWIGQSVWPYPRALERCVPVVESANATLTLGSASAPNQLTSVGLLQRSLFVRSSSSKNGQADRLWAIDLALRCRGVTAVIADGSRLTMAATRRLQLAAAAANALVLLARPPREIREISAATTRWNVERVPPAIHPCPDPLWGLTLLRAKGAQKSHVTIRPAEAAGRRRNQPSFKQPANQQLHAHAARPCPTPSFPFHRPVPAPTPTGDASSESPGVRSPRIVSSENVVPSPDPHNQRARLDRSALQ